jgi:hypothetical protein
VEPLVEDEFEFTTAITDEATVAAVWPITLGVVPEKCNAHSRFRLSSKHNNNKNNKNDKNNKSARNKIDDVGTQAVIHERS